MGGQPVINDEISKATSRPPLVPETCLPIGDQHSILEGQEVDWVVSLRRWVRRRHSVCCV